MLTKRMTLAGAGALTLVIGLIVLLGAVMGGRGTVPQAEADTPPAGNTYLCADAPGALDLLPFEVQNKAAPNHTIDVPANDLYCDAVTKNGTPPADPNADLACWPIPEAQQVESDIAVTLKDQFGAFSVDVGNAKEWCETVAKPPFIPNKFSPVYECYRIQDNMKNRTVQINSPQFGLNEDVDLGAPDRLCVNSFDTTFGKGETTPVAPDLVCYNVNVPLAAEEITFRGWRAANDTVTPTRAVRLCVPAAQTVKPPEGTGNLSGMFDILVHPDGDDSIGLFHCISRTDHYPDNTMKNNAVCYADTNQGDPASVIPSTCPKSGPCNRGPDVAPGPNPPPPYGGGNPSKGLGVFAGGTVTFTTCFANLGGALGPNVLSVVNIPNAKAQLAANSTMTGTVLVYGNQGIDECHDLSPNGPAPAPLGITLYRVADLAKNPDAAGVAASWRSLTGPVPVLDFDQDGCNDQDELDKARATKPCGDDPYNPYDSDENFNSSFNLTVQVVRADACDAAGNPPGPQPFFCDGAPLGQLVPGSYFNCIADIQHNTTTNALVATPFCYTDNILSTVNPEDAGGANTCPPAPAEKCGDGLPGAGPPTLDALGDVDDPHTTLTGQYNKVKNQLELEGCFESVANDLLGPKVYTRIVLDAHTMNGTADIWLNRTDCTKPTTAPSTKGAPVSGTEQAPKTGTAANDWDTDQDGCSDKQELGNNEAIGGLRDPSNPFDFYDVDNSRNVDLFNDIFGVAFKFGQTAAQLGAEDNAKFNRGAPIGGGAGPWNLHGPDATVDLFNDIFGVAFQFGHNCN